MSASSYKYLLVAVLLALYGCKSTKQVTITEEPEEYFEEFQGKQIAAGHYGGYFILDGDKRVYKLHLSSNEEIIIESDFEEGQVVYSGRDFFKHRVILFQNDEVYRVLKGNLNIYKNKDQLEATIDVWGVKDMWELVSDSIPEVEDGQHHKIVFEGRIEEKRLD